MIPEKLNAHIVQILAIDRPMEHVPHFSELDITELPKVRTSIPTHFTTQEWEKGSTRVILTPIGEKFRRGTMRIEDEYGAGKRLESDHRTISLPIR
jgi:hypothetical protein